MSTVLIAAGITPPEDIDGITDTAEDPSRNGIVDPGETDPDSENTDGDGANDGDELRAGTDPLNAADFFHAELSPSSNGVFYVTWRSNPGSFYTLQTTTSLTNQTWFNLETHVPAAPSGQRTTHSIPPPPTPATVVSTEWKLNNPTKIGSKWGVSAVEHRLEYTVQRLSRIILR